MGRTNIEIDEELVTRVMSVHRLASKHEAVDFALRRLVGSPMSKDETLAMECAGWDGDLDASAVERSSPGLTVMLVDTFAWVEYLRPTGSPANLRLREALDADESLGTTDVVVMELLSGSLRDAAILHANGDYEAISRHSALRMLGLLNA